MDSVPCIHIKFSHTYRQFFVGKNAHQNSSAELLACHEEEYVFFLSDNVR